MAKQRMNFRDKEIGARVRTRRLMLNMTQESLGKALGLTFQQIQKYEKGANRISGSRILDIASALKVEPATLLIGNSPRTAHDGDDDELTLLLASADVIKLLRAFHKVTGIRRAAIVNLVIAVANGRASHPA